MGKKSIPIVLLAALIGTVLMWAVYLLPTEPMAENIIASKSVLKEQDDTNALLKAEYWKVFDRNTNIIMLYEAIYPGSGNAFLDSLLVPTYNYIDDWMQDWSECISEYAIDRESTTDTLTYARYWHGYLVFLKPLFLFMDLSGIYALNTCLTLLLFLVNIYLFHKRLGDYWVAYAAMVLMMYPHHMVLSFQLSSVFAVMQLTVFFVLFFDKWEEKRIEYIFLLDGILIAFFDFLTYPLVACVIPLLTYYLLHSKDSIKDSIVTGLRQGLSFLFGYAGMWFMKWIIATIFTSENIIMDALNSVFHRTGMSDSMSSESSYVDISAFTALQRNLDSFFNGENLIFLALIICVLTILVYLHRKKLQWNMNHILVCMLIALLPFVWIAILSNHATYHPHLEWRNFAVLIFAGAASIISLFQRRVKE